VEFYNFSFFRTQLS